MVAGVRSARWCGISLVETQSDADRVMAISWKQCQQIIDLEGVIQLASAIYAVNYGPPGANAIEQAVGALARPVAFDQKEGSINAHLLRYQLPVFAEE